MAKKDNSQDKLINLQAQQLAAQVANWASQLDFAKERFRLLEMPQYQSSSQLEIDKLAFEKASETWKEAFQEASVTGTYQGQPTTEWLTQQAQLTGVLNGQQTLQGKLTDAQVTQMNEQMRLANQQFLAQNTGYLDGRPTFEREQWETGQSGYMGNGQSTMARQQMEANLTGMYGGQSTMARQQMEAGLTGYYGGKSTLEREKFGAETTQNYLNLLASLQGPGNAFKQLRVLNATPGGLQGMVNSWAGTYGQAGFGSSGAPGQAQISDLYSGYTGAPGQSPTGAPVAASPLAAPPPPPAYSPGQGLPPAPTYAGPVTGPPASPQPGLPAAPTGLIPGRGFASTQWNPATQAAVTAWNAAHPGYIADGSQIGYHTDPSYAPATAPTSGASVTLPPPMTGPEANAPLPVPAGTPIPGRGFDSSQWNAATQAAVTAWNAAHPGYVADGSQQGWHLAPASAPALQPITNWSDPGAAAAKTALLGQQPPQGDTGGGQVNQAMSIPTPTGVSSSGSPYYMPSYTYSPEGTQAPVGAYNYTATDQGHTQVYPPGQVAPSDQAQVSSTTPMDYSAANSLLATPAPGTGGSLSPSQINAANYNKTNPYAQQMMWAWFENQGWDPQAAKGEFTASLPKYAGPQKATVSI
jgi:hypothetical protein